MERWKPAPGYESRYAVSDQGRIFSWPRKVARFRHFVTLPARYLKCGTGNHGYVHMTVESRPNKHVLIHRFVATAFIHNPDGLPFVNHIDSNRANNRVANLEWCTNSQNIVHAIKAGAFRTKLTPAIVKEIRSCGGLDTPTAAKFGVSQVLVTKIRARKVWKHID